MPSSPEADHADGSALAVAAEAAYLVNLLLLPVIGFAGLLYLYLSQRRQASPLARCHLEQTMRASLWGGLLLVVINGLIILLGGYQGVNTWIIVILYFTLCHSAFVVFGAVGLAKALAGQCWRYPLVGAPVPGDLSSPPAEGN
jgi:hypothetical protein